MTDAFTPQHCYKMWDEMKNHPNCQIKQKNQRCVYAKVIRKDLAEPYISICVKGLGEDCRVGFRGAKPWRITGYHVAGVGDPVVIECGNVKLRIVRNIYGMQNNMGHPYDGPTDIAIRIWWNECLKVSIIINNQRHTYYICP